MISSHDPSLDARLEREAQFHDTKYDGGGSPRHYNVSPSTFIHEQMR